MRHGEQARVFRMIPAFRAVEFARYGSIHRNTFVCAPRLLAPTLELRMRPGRFLAGTLVGGEGYVEAIATGLLAGQNAARSALGESLLRPPPESMIGALVHHLVSADPSGFQPMNVNLGLLPPLAAAGRREDRTAALVERGCETFRQWLEREGITPAAAPPAAS
jgi:methylenetetrahydrofolate--tRNA-(uracil-5-)-methyltransferase